MTTKKPPGSSEPTCLHRVLRLDSVTWRSAQEVDRPNWHHWIAITEPKNVETNQVLLFIAGGETDDPPPQPKPKFAELANEARSIVAEVRMIPNQPLKFADEERTRKEDEIIAYAWDKYLKTGDEDWLIRFSMAEAVMHAMDTIQEAYPQVTGFVLTGRSKRGWTAWTVAGADPRVTGVIPAVIDLLNLKRSMEHHYRSYGFWSPALQDYEEMNIPQRWNTPAFQQLLSLVEPFSYRELVTMPKYIINATGDEFFLPDSSNFYFKDLIGPKYLRYVPNSDHSLSGTDCIRGVAAFHRAISLKKPLPNLTWAYKENQLTVETDQKPAQIKVWRAHNPDARDFRLSTIGPTWESETLKTSSVTIEEPPIGWSAAFIELTYPNGEGYPFVFTTDVIVTPDHLPYTFQHD